MNPSENDGDKEGKYLKKNIEVFSTYIYNP